MCIQGDFDIVGGVRSLAEAEAIKVLFAASDAFLHRFLGSARTGCQYLYLRVILVRSTVLSEDAHGYSFLCLHLVRIGS